MRDPCRDPVNLVFESDGMVTLSTALHTRLAKDVANEDFQFANWVDGVVGEVVHSDEDCVLVAGAGGDKLGIFLKRTTTKSRLQLTYADRIRLACSAR